VIPKKKCVLACSFYGRAGKKKEKTLVAAQKKRGQGLLAAKIADRKEGPRICSSCRKGGRENTSLFQRQDPKRTKLPGPRARKKSWGLLHASVSRGEELVPEKEVGGHSYPAA